MLFDVLKQGQSIYELLVKFSRTKKNKNNWRLLIFLKLSAFFANFIVTKSIYFYLDCNQERDILNLIMVPAVGFLFLIFTFVHVKSYGKKNCYFMRAAKLPFLYTEVVAWRSFVKKMFLKISQNSEENTCDRVFF